MIQKTVTGRVDLNQVIATMSPYTLAQWIVDLETTTEKEWVIKRATAALEAIVGIDEATMMLEQV